MVAISRMPPPSWVGMVSALTIDSMARAVLRLAGKGAVEIDDVEELRPLGAATPRPVRRVVVETRCPSP